MSPGPAAKSATPQGATLGAALVVGAGVAGLRAALDLADLGCAVTLVDSAPAVGGLLARLDHQFPDDHCGLCQLLPHLGREDLDEGCLRRGLLHERIEVLAGTSVAALRGEPGAFEVELRRAPVFVDPERCTACGGRCVDACPVELPNPFGHGPATRKAIGPPALHALPNLYSIDMQACTRCGACVEACPAAAIDLSAAPATRTLRADVVLLAVGCGVYDATADPETLRYRVSPDVVTALEFERLLRRGGRRRGPLRRPSDGRPLGRIAWLQCVGSRDPRRDRDFCSSVCCSFAIKEAVLAHRRGGAGVETTIFAMDLRAHAKGQHRYRLQAEREHGLRLRRGRPHSVTALGDGSLRVAYSDPDTGDRRHDLFDMVVLSTGQAQPQADGVLAEALAFPTAPDDPAPLVPLERALSPRPGVLRCGTFGGLSDIAEAVTSGSAAASHAARLLAALGRRLESRVGADAVREPPAGRPQVDVLLCRCPGHELPLETLRSELSRTPGVRNVEVLEQPCRPAGRAALERRLRRPDCERVVVGGCAPAERDGRLERIAAACGLDPALVRPVALPLAPGVAARAAEDERVRAAVGRLRGSVASLRAAPAVPSVRVAVEQQVLVVGGGIAGLRAALAVAERGVGVQLVERGARLGGRVARLRVRTADGQDAAALADDAIERVRAHRHVTIHLQAEPIGSSGGPGRFRTRIRRADGEEVELRHGATILATGGAPAPSVEYGHGTRPRVVTQAALAAGLRDGSVDAAALGAVGMIQCVGSRSADAHAYCSRVCCVQALANALELRRANPEGTVLILVRDVMAYGPWERLYTEARRQGVLFARYKPQRPPQLSFEGDVPVLRFVDPLLQRPVELRADLLALATGIVPAAGAAALADIFGVERTEDGFVREANAKWRPVEASRDGVFVAGVAHSPMPVAEVVLQAEAAAGRACALLARPQLVAPRDGASVRHRVCARCEACLPACPYAARSYDPEQDRIVVDPLACRACGLCVPACRNGASVLPGQPDTSLLATIEATLASLPGGSAGATRGKP